MPFRLSPSNFPEDVLSRICNFESSESFRLKSRENSWLELKESFNLGDAQAYAKTAAAFANADGGYIVFGVKNKPHDLVGLQSKNFETADPARITNALNEHFSPEFEWDMHLASYRGRTAGLLYFAPAAAKPVVCTRDGAEIKQGFIYYRYRGKSELIRYRPCTGSLRMARLANEICG